MPLNCSGSWGAFDVRCQSAVDAVVYTDHSKSHEMSDANIYQVNAGPLGRLAPDRQTWTDPQISYQWRIAAGGVQRDPSDVEAMAGMSADTVSHQKPFN